MAGDDADDVPIVITGAVSWLPAEHEFCYRCGTYTRAAPAAAAERVLISIFELQENIPSGGLWSVTICQTCGDPLIVDGWQHEDAGINPGARGRLFSFSIGWYDGLPMQEE